ncbi:metal ABC transporter solute-binding protein, Zn/Mn family [Camelliibacillus cellulosilyticus]|uniref:Metal ABC transporter solute-binding protein, Zn/Mn family n=1 Tax=Camelliibacillus cellulosilyticus TaxID=2174486 RepID=A0ABV9GK08_9BACL
MQRRKQVNFIGMLFLVLGFVLAGCNSEQKTAGSGEDQAEKRQKITVVAAENFYGGVAKAVGGDHVKVISIIAKPNVDPHDFEPTPRDAKTISHSQLIIYNGLGYDDWMSHLIASGSGGKEKAILRVGEDVLQIKKGANEHVWYMPDTMGKLAAQVADQLATIDPDHAEYYHDQADQYEQSLKPLQDLVNRLKLKHPQEVETTEPVFDYMLEALNYKVNNKDFPKAVEEETDPAPKDLMQMQEDLKNHRVAFFVQNVQVEQPAVTQLADLAQKYHVPIVKVSETMPEGKDYQTWMIDQLKQIERVSNEEGAK